MALEEATKQVSIRLAIRERKRCAPPGTTDAITGATLKACEPTSAIIIR